MPRTKGSDDARRGQPEMLPTIMKLNQITNRGLESAQSFSNDAASAQAKNCGTINFAKMLYQNGGCK